MRRTGNFQFVAPGEITGVEASSRIWSTGGEHYFCFDNTKLFVNIYKFSKEVRALDRKSAQRIFVSVDIKGESPQCYWKLNDFRFHFWNHKDSSPEICIFIRSIILKIIEVNVGMKKTEHLSEQDKKAMKALFDLKRFTENLRWFNPSFLSKDTVLELYSIVIDLVSMVRFLRISNEHPVGGQIDDRKNPSMKEIPPTYDNVGGLVQIRPANRYLIFSEKEKNLLDYILNILLIMKKLIDEDKELPSLRFNLPGQDQQESRNNDISKTSSNKRNSHFFYKRKKKRN
jgi:hypothetical protein